MSNFSVKMRVMLAVAVAGLSLAACGSNPAATPEKAFKNLTHWTRLGNPDGMSRFAEKKYIEKLTSSYEDLYFLSEVWPQKPFVLESSIDDGKATLKVEAVTIKGRPVTGTFHLVLKGEEWKVREGAWDDMRAVWGR